MSGRSAAMSALLKRLWSDPEYRAKRSAEARQRWADPKYRARLKRVLSKAASTPEARKRKSELTRAQFADPASRAAASARVKEFFAANPERLEEWIARLNADKGFFWCPPELEKLYHKLRRHFGAEQAREQIRELLAKEFAGMAQYDEAA